MFSFAKTLIRESLGVSRVIHINVILQENSAAKTFDEVELGSFERLFWQLLMTVRSRPRCRVQGCQEQGYIRCRSEGPCLAPRLLLFLITWPGFDKTSQLFLSNSFVLCDGFEHLPQVQC